MHDADLLKAKQKEWKHRLGGRDVHSISVQIGHMLWRSAFYRSINVSRKFLPADGEGGERANGSLHELIDDGYLTVHAAAIRRLLDKGAISGPKGVYSLYGLIKDIKDNASLLTRTNVLAARGLEYNYEPVKERARQEAWAKRKARGEGATFVSMVGWADSEYWHEAMDKLCGIAPEHRSADDAPEPERFQRLLNEFDERGRSVRDYVDKYIAHASSPDSRQSLHPENRTLSLAKLWLAERVTLRAANFISYHIVDGTNLGGVPIAQFDQFAHLDRAFVERSAMSVMREEWERHCREVESCEDWFWDLPLADESDVWE